MLPTPSTFLSRRDHQFERDALQCSLVEREIRNHLDGTGVRAYMPVAFAKDGNPVVAEHQLKVYPKSPYRHRRVSDMSWPLPVQRECQPLVELYHDIHPAVVNDDPRFIATHFMLRIAQINSRLSTPPLSGAPVSSFDKWDQITGRNLGAHLHLTGSWNSESPADGPWMLTPPSPTCAGNDILVRDAAGNIRYALRMIYDNSGYYVVLPLSFYRHPDYPAGPLVLFIPPRPPYILINSQWLGAFPFATVILTDDIQAVMANEPTQDLIVLGNPGGDAWIENLDVQPLQGRKVICHAVVEEGTPEAQQKAGQSLMLIASKLGSLGITPDILHPQFGPLAIPYNSPFQPLA